MASLDDRVAALEVEVFGATKREWDAGEQPEKLAAVDPVTPAPDESAPAPDVQVTQTGDGEPAAPQGFGE